MSLENILGLDKKLVMKFKELFLLNIATLTFLHGPMYLELDYYPPYSDKNQSFLRHTLTEVAAWR